MEEVETVVEVEQNRLVLHSNIVIIEPNDVAKENFELLPDLMSYIKSVYPRVYHNTLQLYPNQGEIGFDLLGLGITNRVVFCDDSQSRLSYIKQIATNHYIPYFTDTHVIKYFKDIPPKPYDLIIGSFVEDNFDDPTTSIKDFFNYIRSHVTSTADLYFIQSKDVEKFKHIAQIEGFYHETSIKMFNKTVMHFKVQHSFVKNNEGYKKSLRGFFARI